jgi:hypothetical protein
MSSRLPIGVGTKYSLLAIFSLQFSVGSWHEAVIQAAFYLVKKLPTAHCKLPTDHIFALKIK